jgi:hypothetical protein
MLPELLCDFGLWSHALDPVFLHFLYALNDIARQCLDDRQERAVTVGAIWPAHGEVIRHCEQSAIRVSSTTTQAYCWELRWTGTRPPPLPTSLQCCGHWLQWDTLESSSC